VSLDPEYYRREVFLNIAILTKEYPPHIYGGAGAHVEHLTRELGNLDGGAHEIQVLCFGDQEESAGKKRVTGIHAPQSIQVYDERHRTLVDTLERNGAMVGLLKQADVIHCHTWYTHLAGCLLREMLDAPLVLTTHSLELQRPWKREQLGTGYYASSWIEKTAYQNADGVVAVSAAMREDVHNLYHVALEKIALIYNGIDDDVFRPREDPDVLLSYGIDPARPYVLMVTRLTRQKGIVHFLEAAKYLGSGVQVVMCASAPDTQTFMEEVSGRFEEVRTRLGADIIWVEETVPTEDLVALYSRASLFVCPSIYEPFGITNLEAMACETPVVASAVGGIKEVVVDGETGRLIPFEAAGAENPEPKDPVRFAHDLASAVNDLLASPSTLKAMGVSARQRVQKHFSWRSIARQTLDFYQKVRNQ
jgi:starch synthase